MAKSSPVGVGDLPSLRTVPETRVVWPDRSGAASRGLGSANIVEGFKKRGKPDKVRYFNIAQASLEETRYYLWLARDLGYIDGELPDVEEVSRLLEGYMKRIVSSAF